VEVVYEGCAGLEVHKKSITACVLWALPKGKKKQEKRRFASFTHDLPAMADWLRECGVTHVAMESTGVRVSLVKRLERLGHIVTLQPIVESA
jgi:transposase